MNSPDRLRALLAEPGLVVMPAVWDGLSAKLAAGAGFRTAFLSGSCVAASRLGGPDLDLLSSRHPLVRLSLVGQPLVGQHVGRLPLVRLALVGLPLVG